MVMGWRGILFALPLSLLCWGLIILVLSRLL